MPLLDGKYEILTERALGPGQTLFEATAPDGADVVIHWFDLRPEQETSFERYRRLLRRLRREDRAALHDVVSRPGAHYVAWYPPNGARPTAPDDELLALLREAGFADEQADVRRDGRRAKLYGLAFGDTAAPTVAAPPAAPAPATPERAALPAWLLPNALTALFLLATVAVAYLGFALRANDRLVELPALLGADVNEAGATLRGLGLEFEAAPVSSRLAAGTVVRMDPPPGASLRPGRSVLLSYALPAGQVTPVETPRLTTLRYPEQVSAVLEEVGLRVGRVSRIPSDQPAGLVISQSPAAGESAGRASEVDVLVSAGPRGTVTFVPDLVGLPLEEARYLASLAGLRPDRVSVDEVATGGQPGTVIAQSLRPNLPLRLEEAALRLVVARGPAGPPAEQGLPSFVGMPLDQARALATGFRVSVSELSVLALPEGVVDQSPAPGSPVGSGALELVVNLHPVPIPRPAATAEVRRPEPRAVPFAWFVEPGIPSQLARVYAVTLEGEASLVELQEVQGGEWVRGEWRTTYPGPVTFRLTLNGEPYGGELLVH